MFERLTDRARLVVALAEEEARLLSHNYIGTEHILLGLLHEGESVAARALESLGISLKTARAGRGDQGPRSEGPLWSHPLHAAGGECPQDLHSRGAVITTSGPSTSCSALSATRMVPPRKSW